MGRAWEEHGVQKEHHDAVAGHGLNPCAIQTHCGEVLYTARCGIRVCGTMRIMLPLGRRQCVLNMGASMLEPFCGARDGWPIHEMGRGARSFRVDVG